MKKFLAIAIAALPLSCITPTFAVEVGDTVEYQYVCVTAESVEAHIDAYEKAGNDAASALVRNDLMAGNCAALPQMESAISEVGKVRPPIKWVDGTQVRLQAVKTRGFWTTSVEPVV